MGILITLKTPVFKQGNRISKTPPYPLYLKELTTTNLTQIDYISESKKNNK